MRNHIITVCVVFASALTACRMDGIEGPALADDSAVWDVQLNHQAALLSLQSPYDTLKLKVAARNVRGIEILQNVGATFSTSSRDVAVDSSGTIRAVGATSEAWVVAEAMLGLIHFKDSVRIRVQTAAPAVMPEQISIAVDSPKIAAKVYLGFFTAGFPADKSVSARVTGANGQVISNPYVRYWVSDSSAAVINAYTGILYGRMPGQSIWVYAGSTIFGVPLLDSVQLQITNPLLTFIGVNSWYVGASGTPELSFIPTELRVGIGGTVIFRPYDTIPYDVQFDDPERVASADLVDCPECAFLLFAPGRGNIDPTIPNPDGFLYARTFWHPGRYRYKSERLKIEGVIVVE